VLIGQPNLRDVLARPELEQLRQRVTVRYHLQALDSDETHAYVNHRLRRAAIGAPLEFSRDVTDLIHLHAQGLPRKTNIIADAMLLFGYGEERRGIDVDLTQEVLEELEATGVIAPPATATRPQTAPQTAPTPAVAVVPAPVNAELSAREAQIARRERQLGEQQRILAEEYRLLRQHRETPPSAPKSVEPPRASWTPVSRPAPSTTHAPVVARRATTSVPPRIARTVPQPVDSVWTRLRRGLFALAKPVWED